MLTDSASGPDKATQPQNQEMVVDLKDQFEQQQSMISQLKDTLHKNQEQLMNKGKQVEEYAAKLSNIKSRSRASKRGVKRDVPKDNSESQSPTGVEEQQTVQKKLNMGEEQQPLTKEKQDKTRQGSNLHLLRKKLEENRMKFEQRGKDSSENKRIEEMVEQLKSQLNERDQIIKELQRNFESPSVTLHQMELSTDEQKESQMEDVSPVETEEPNPLLEEIGQLKHCIQELHSTIECKDSIISELNYKITSLENNILDLQENLKEKDQVIDARTKAIALMSEDLSRKGKTTLDTLEETREQMRIMQQNFVALETRMKQEKEQLSKEIEAKDKRLAQLEEGNKKLESVRFDLSVRNAEFQEKLVRLQEHCAELQTEINQNFTDSVKIEELSKSLDNANKQLIKIKAQHKNKMKSLKSEIERLKSTSENEEEIVRLQNKVAELEEEKGNLQLNLVDFDELKALEHHLQERVSELESTLQKQVEQLSDYSHTVSLLESEKQDLIHSISDCTENIKSLEQQVSDLKSVVSDLENQKISLEMKSVELEEEMDMLIKDKKELVCEMNHKTNELLSLTERLKELEESVKFDIHENILGNVNKLGEKLEIDCERLNISVQTDDEELSSDKIIIQNQQDLIKELESKVEINEAKLSEQEEVIDLIEEMQQKKQEEQFESFSEVCKELKDVTADLQEWKQRCEEVEMRLTSLDNEKSLLEEGFEEIKKENEALTSELQDKKGNIDILTDKLREQSDAIAEREREIRKLQEMIEDNGHKLEEREAALQNVHKTIESLQQEYDTRCLSLQSVLNSKEQDLEIAVLSLTNANAEIEQKNSEIDQLKQNLDSHRLMVENLENSLNINNDSPKSLFEDRVKDLSELLQKEHEANSALVQDIENMQKELTNKNFYIQKLELELKNSHEIEAQLELTISANEDLKITKSLLDNKILEVETLSKQIEELHVKNKEKTEKMKKLAANLKAKTLAVKNCEEKIKNLESIIEAKEVELVRLAKELEDKTVSLNEVKQQLEENVDNLNRKEAQVERLNAEILFLSNEIENLHVKSSSSKETQINDETDLLLSQEYGSDKSKESNIEKLKNELDILTEDNKVKKDKILMLTDKVSNLTQRIRHLEQSKSEKSTRIVELEGEADSRDMAYFGALGKVECLEGMIADNEKQLESNVTDSKSSAEKITVMEHEVLGKDLRIIELEEQSLTEERSKESIIEKLKNELDVLSKDNKAKKDKILMLTDKVSILTQRTRHLEQSKSEKSTRIVELEGEADSRDMAYCGALGKVECLQGMIADNEKQLESNVTDSKSSAEKITVMEHEVLGRDLRIIELEEQVSLTEDRYHHAWLAAQAKIQERDAVIEALEQTLAKTQERVVALEDSLSNIEERRKSLEGKADLLGEKLEESNREKEEVVETEEILELKLHELENNEQNMKEKLIQLKEDHYEMIQKYSDLQDENKELQRTISGYESGIKTLQYEIERLSEYETAYKEEEKKVEALKLELKQATSNHERKMMDRIEEIGQYSNSLELELKARNDQIEIIDTERKELLKHVEQLKLELANAEEKVRTSVEELEEKFYSSGTQVGSLKDEINHLHDKIDILLREQQTSQSKLAEQDNMLKIYEDKFRALTELQNQKENEIKSYQSRLLQFQFGSQESVTKINDDYEEKLLHLESENKHLHESVTAQVKENSEMKEKLIDVQKEKVNVENKLISYEEHVNSLTNSLKESQEIIQHKIEEVNQLSEALEQLHNNELNEFELKSKLSMLEEEKNNLLKQLLEEKAKKELDNIFVEAKETVHKIKTVVGTNDATSQTESQDDSSSIPVREHVPEAAKFFNLFSSPQGSEEDQMNFIGRSASHCSGDCIIRLQQLEDKINRLEIELRSVVSEKESALKHIEELETQLNQLHQAKVNLIEPVPVAEEICAKSSAYLTYGPDVSEASDSKPKLISFFQDVPVVDNSSNIQAELAALKFEKESAVKELEEKLLTLQSEKEFAVSELETKLFTLNSEKELVVKELEAKLLALNLEKESAVNELEAKLTYLKSEKECVVNELERKLIILETEKEATINDLETKLVAVKDERDCCLKSIEELTQQLKQLRQPEILSSEPAPVVEDVCMKDSAYLTYEPDVVDTSGSEPRLISVFQDSSAVEPKLISVFQDNVCAGNSSEPRILSVFDENESCKDDTWNLVFNESIQEDEEWGWGSDEARLEEEHLLLKQQEAAHANVIPIQLNEKICSLENQILELDSEKEKLLEEVREMQDRNSKLLKKLKDLKLKNDNLMKENLEMTKKLSAGLGFGDLDSAIEEELKIRIDSLEKEIKELKNDKESVRLEKENLLKRVDVLSSANDRFVELKERQDIEMEICQHKNKELINQVQALEWKIEELMEESTGKEHDVEGKDISFSPSTEIVSKPEVTDGNEKLKKIVDELQDQLLALEDDNYNLQTLLEEQRQLRLLAERAVNEMETKIRKLLTVTDNIDHNINIDKNFDSFDNIVLYIEKFITALSFEKKVKEKEHVPDQNVSTNIEFKQIDLFKSVESNLVTNDFEIGVPKECCQSIRKDYDDICSKFRVIEENLIESNKKCEKLNEEIKTRDEEISKLNNDCQTMKRRYEEENMSIKEQLLLSQAELTKASSAESFREQPFKTFKIGTLSDETEQLNLRIREQDEIVAKLNEQVIKKSEEIADHLNIIESLKEEKLILEQQVNSVRKDLEIATAAASEERHHREVVVQELHEKLWLNDSARQNQIEKVIQEKEGEMKLIKTQCLEKETILQNLLKEKESEIKTLRQELAIREKMFVEQSNVKDSREISDLKILENMLTEQKLNFSSIISAREQDIENLKIQILEKEKEVEEKLFVKEEDIKNLRIQLNDKEQRVIEITEAREKDIQNFQLQITERDNKIYELSRELEEEEKHLLELQEILDEKEGEIYQLREKLKQEREDLKVGSIVDEKPKEHSEKTVEKNELDLALYMLHQRDVRIDELTLELMQLLEERDTLQLRLSTAIRLNEELRAKSAKSVTPPSTPNKSSERLRSESEDLSAVEPASSPEDGRPSQTPTMETKEDLHDLENKLSQLHSVGYLRDATLKDEREQRHIEQMNLLHRRTPGIVVDANYTLSRDVQSPSKVIFNWIRGRREHHSKWNTIQQ